MKRVLLAVALLFASVAFAQVPPRVTLTASNVLDSGGSAPLMSGKLCFVTTDANDKPMGYRVGSGSGQTSASPDQAPCATVTNGVISPIQIINSAASSPLNACIRVVTKNEKDIEIRRSKCVQTGTADTLLSWCAVSGGVVACNWDKYPIGTIPVPLVQLGPPGPQGNNGADGTNGLNGCMVGGSCASVIGGYFGQYDAFGDSITQGVQSSTYNTYSECPHAGSGTCYVAQLASVVGVPVTNHGIGGDEAADQQIKVYSTSFSTTNHQLVTYQIGTNDGGQYFTNLNGLNMFRNLHAATIAYIATAGPNQYRLADNPNCTFSGSWASSTYSSIGKMTTHPGDSVTCSNLNGDALYAAVTMIDGNHTAQFTVGVDGSGAQPIAWPYGDGYGTLPIITGHGVTYGDQLIRIPTSFGSHSITITMVTGSSGTLNVNWVAGNGQTNFAGAPTLLVAGPIMSSTVPSGDPNVNYKRAVYSEVVHANADLLQQDGLRIAYMAANKAMDASLDDLADGTHPNDPGYAHLANGYLATLLSVFKQGIRHSGGLYVSGMDQEGGGGAGSHTDYDSLRGVVTHRAIAQSAAGDTQPYGTERWSLCQYNEYALPDVIGGNTDIACLRELTLDESGVIVGPVPSTSRSGQSFQLNFANPAHYPSDIRDLNANNYIQRRVLWYGNDGVQDYMCFGIPGPYGGTGAEGTTCRLKVGTIANVTPEPLFVDIPSSSTGTNYELGSYTQPGLATGNANGFQVGVGRSVPFNSAVVGFHYAGAGSHSNTATLGLFGTPAVTVDGDGNVTTPHGFTGTKTAGTCVLTISSGIITDVSGC